MTLKRPSEYSSIWGVTLWCFLPACLADLDASQHRHGCFESLVSGTLVVGGKTIEFADLLLTSLLALASCKVPRRSTLFYYHDDDGSRIC
jgi:hypothetical protein